jgi:hypothetical protein
MEFKTTEQSQTFSNREKHVKAANFNPQNPTGDNITSENKSNPRSIHGWKVSSPLVT